MILHLWLAHHSSCVGSWFYNPTPLSSVSTPNDDVSFSLASVSERRGTRSDLAWSSIATPFPVSESWTIDDEGAIQRYSSPIGREDEED